MRRLAGAFFAAAFFADALAGAFARRLLASTLGRSLLRAAFRRRFAGAFFAAAFLRADASPVPSCGPLAAFLRPTLRRSLLRRCLLARRLAGFRAVVFFATRRLAGLRAVVFFAVVFRAVRLFAGGTVTTFLEGCSGVGAVLLAYLFTADLKAAPAENFTPFDAAICTGSPVRGLRPVRAARDERENEPKPGKRDLVVARDRALNGLDECVQRALGFGFVESCLLRDAVDEL